MTAGNTIQNNQKGGMQKILDGIEKMGNKVPHPVLMFLYLIILVVVLSHVLYLFNVSVTEEIVVRDPPYTDYEYYNDPSSPGYREEDYQDDKYEYTLEERTISIRSLLTTEGIRFIFTSFVPNFQGFGVVAVTFIAMMGAGVAEAAGLMSAMIRKLVKVAPRGLITFIIVFVGVLSSVATDAGYLILIPLGAAAFITLRRHPLAGMAAAFAGVSAVFGVNIIFTPIDSMLTEITNEAISLSGGTPLSLAANLFFAIGSSLVMAIVVTWVTDKIVEPRLSKFDFDAYAAEHPEIGDANVFTPEEMRGLKYAVLASLAMIVLVLVLTLPSGAPLRRPEGYLGSSPLLDSLLFIITMLFFVAGVAYGKGAGTFKSSNDVIGAVTKTFSNLAGLMFMFLMIAQFIAYFNFTNMPTVLAISMAGVLETLNVGALPLLIGLIFVIMILNVILPGVVPKWAIFAPVFIPIFVRLGVAPQTVLAAYRVGDSPLNVITPLMVYLPFVVTVAQRYDKESGIGTVIALMLPYTVVVAIAWTLFFVLWFVLGIPLGPGYPVSF
jgi:aminobenzoyl-glutamate transport protein